MQAEVISIGDELTSGQRLDTNSQWLSTRLAEIGVHTMYHTTVADDLEANVRVFKTAIDRADLIVATGGLGPTADDLTRDAIAAAAEQPLELDKAALKHIENLFARRARPYARTQPRAGVLSARYARVFTIRPARRRESTWTCRAPGRRACRIVRIAGRPGGNAGNVATIGRAGNSIDGRAGTSDLPSPDEVLRRRRKRP